MNAKKPATITAPPFIPFERNSGRPFYKQIYDGCRAAILSGRLQPGQRLPSTRALAVELKISRLPVINAYEQLLHEGYIEGKVGAGTYVKGSIPDELTVPVLVGDSAERQDERARSLRTTGAYSPGTNTSGEKELLGPFRVSLPALDHFPYQIWSRLVSRHAKNLSVDLMAYGDPAGLLTLREAIAQYLRTARAVNCETSQVLIVSGSQMALQLCSMALLTPRDAACLEEPGYPGARDALRSTGATLIPIALDGEGIMVEEVASRGKKVRAVYVTPSHQYPLGLSMSASRRLELLDWARRGRAWIIEDDYDSEYRYASRPIGALQGMDTGSRVIYIGTFSKVLFPSLRLGYVVVPPLLLNKFIRLRETLDLFSPTLYQLVLTDFLQEGHFARHLRRMRSVYLRRRDALVEGLGRHLGELLKPCNADAGLHLSAFLPRGMDDLEIVRRCAQRGINASPLSACYMSRRPKSGLILGFGGSDESRIGPAVQKLSKIVRELVC
jgi:GntR family transcriptional regulator / MocR family aminotransferase